MTDSLQLSEQLLYLRGRVLQLAFVLALIRALLWIYAWYTTRNPVSQVNGPPKSDWFFGNLTDFHFKDAGSPQISWQELYGLVCKIHALFGEEYLLISDSKAVKHVYTNMDAFAARGNTRELIKAITGPGLVIVDGDDHKRQRRVMQPAFGTSQLKALFPTFIRHNQHLSLTLKKDIDVQGDGRIAKVDMYGYISKVTLDTIGDAAFDHKFGALDDKQHYLRNATGETQSQSIESASKAAVFTQYIIEYLPSLVVSRLIHLPIKKFASARALRDVALTIADQMVKEKLYAFEQGLEGGKDLISLLVRANAMEIQENKLSDIEVNSEIITITLAGHVTVTNTITFGLWELAKNMDMQRRIRQEILYFQHHWIAGYDDDPDNYKNMPLLNAFIKELLRYHPVSSITTRDTVEDAVIPLPKPVRLLSGQVVPELHVSKGQKIWINISGYNRLPELFGPDADEFNVDRWLDVKRNDDKFFQGAGVYSNLMTFGHGNRACIGWRFSVWQMQAIIVDLLSNFEFTLRACESAVRRRRP